MCIDVNKILLKRISTARLYRKQACKQQKYICLTLLRQILSQQSTYTVSSLYTVQLVTEKSYYAFIIAVVVGMRYCIAILLGKVIT